MNRPAERILICVTRQRTCEKLIKFGAEISKLLDAELFVVHSVRTGDSFLGNPIEGEALEYLYSVSSVVGAEMTVLRSDEAEDAIADYARKIGATCIVLGKSPDKSEKFVNALRSRMSGIRFEVI